VVGPGQRRETVSPQGIAPKVQVESSIAVGSGVQDTWDKLNELMY
jgi:hypothetical protein